MAPIVAAVVSMIVALAPAALASRIEGNVTLGGGPPPESGEHPLYGVGMRILLEQKGHIVGKTVTYKKGAFFLRAKPGHYTLIVEFAKYPPPASDRPCDSATVIVHRDKTTHLYLSCGIK
jgi:hypothetical protein